MIKTITEVSYDPIDLDKKAIVFAQVISTNRDDIKETYLLKIKEWVELPYQQEVMTYDEQGNETGIQLQDFVKVQEVRITQRIMTFAEADMLTSYLDSAFPITSIGTYRRKDYTIYGHLVINNQENVRNTNWILC